MSVILRSRTLGRRPKAGVTATNVWSSIVEILLYTRAAMIGRGAARFVLSYTVFATASGRGETPDIQQH